MPTKNRRAAVYLPPDVDEALSVYKDNRRIDGDSAALIAILREFFELGATKAAESPELEKRINSLEKNQPVLQNRVQSLERTVEYLLAEVRSSRSVSLVSSLSNTLSKEDEVDVPNVVEGQNSLRLSPCDAEALAKRFSLGRDAVQRWVGTGKRAKTIQEIVAITRKRDPDGISWLYEPSSGLFYPQLLNPS
jgi:hypothetical protein